ncbi:GDSL lipase/esterase [Dillenia turbinata]|uniref:GDSL lipase/esterase n=1 Tax=Dillenia turbinata TaxID=194707 RepID=A0AAN8UU55_9MAGN
MVSSFVQHILSLVLLSALFFFFLSNASTMKRPFNNSISALFVFGDSTVDAGNNNNLRTMVKSNFPPYGRDFVDHKPTGRFTNGRLPTDFVASYVGIKDYVPAYLDPTLSTEELKTGVSFASANSGYDPLTPRLSNVISLSKQLECFGELKERIEAAIGKEKTDELVKKAVYLVSAGTNDFIVNYYALPLRSTTYTMSQYQQFLLQNTKQFIQGLVNQGARRVAVIGLPPMGCLPIVITLHSGTMNRNCIDSESTVANDYNQMLQKELQAMQSQLAHQNVAIYYVDIYTPMVEMIQDPQKYGFEQSDTGCCGIGLLEETFLCNPRSTVCSDASKYVFWDSVHPTEMGYYLIFESVKPVVDSIIKS